jgi:hypothetical protein
MPEALVITDPRPALWAQALLASSVLFAILSVVLLTTTF